MKKPKPITPFTRPHQRPENGTSCFCDDCQRADALNTTAMLAANKQQKGGTR